MILIQEMLEIIKYCALPPDFLLITYEYISYTASFLFLYFMFYKLEQACMLKCLQVFGLHRVMKYGHWVLPVSMVE